MLKSRRYCLNQTIKPNLINNRAADSRLPLVWFTEDHSPRKHSCQKKESNQSIIRKQLRANPN